MLDKRIEIHIINERWVEAVIDSLRYELPIDSLTLPSHTLFYVRAAIEAKLGIRLTLAQVQTYLLEEGLAPIEDYGMPKWFVQKYFKSHHVKNVQRQANLGTGYGRRYPQANEGSESQAA